MQIRCNYSKTAARRIRSTCVLYRRMHSSYGASETLFQNSDNDIAIKVLVTVNGSTDSLSMHIWFFSD